VTRDELNILAEMHTYP